MIDIVGNKKNVWVELEIFSDRYSNDIRITLSVDDIKDLYHRLKELKILEE